MMVYDDYHCASAAGPAFDRHRLRMNFIDGAVRKVNNRFVDSARILMLSLIFEQNHIQSPLSSVVGKRLRFKIAKVPTSELIRVGRRNPSAKIPVVLRQITTTARVYL